MFSLGIILHSLLTNKIPQHDRSGNPYLNELSNKVSDKVKDILKRLLQIRVANRYQSLEEMLIEYSEFLAEHDKPKVKVAKVGKKKKNNKLLVPVLFILTAILIGVVLAVYWDMLFK